MLRSLFRFQLNIACLLLVFGLLANSGLAADPAGGAEAKLRENLRATMLQLRNVEAERANLLAAQAENELKAKTLAGQVEAMGKQLVADKDAADKALAELRTKVEERDREIGGLRVALEKSNGEHQKASQLAANREALRARLASEAILLNRKVAEQQTKNFAMYKLGSEILARYEKFGLGEALTAREPFVGLTRVKFENLMQDYQDKLAAEKIKP